MSLTDTDDERYLENHKALNNEKQIIRKIYIMTVYITKLDT
jgi:hypothetical protein